MYYGTEQVVAGTVARPVAMYISHVTIFVDGGDGDGTEPKTV